MNSQKNEVSFELKQIRIKSVSWEYSYDQEYLEEFNKGKSLNTPDYFLYSHETDLILIRFKIHL